MAHRLKHILWMIVLLLTVACGAGVNSKSKNSATVNELGYLLIEKQCATGVVVQEAVSKEITQMYTDFQTKYPIAFFSIPVRLYDYKKPMIVNLDDLGMSLTGIKEKINDEVHFQDNIMSIAVELHYLFQYAMRFEANKCAFPVLVTKKDQELRPYLFMKDFCMEKENSEICGPNIMDNLTQKEASFVEDNTLKMCTAFNGSMVNCQAQYIIQKQNNQTGTLVGYYQKRFEEERYNKLFMLSGSHLNFQCTKDLEQTIMTVKITSAISQSTLAELAKFVEQTWTNESFKLKIEIVASTGSDVVEILPSQSSISRVPDNDNRKVYLSQMLDNETSKKVLAHEFGHVLGFPDCYTEFFDNQSKDLIYYEISSDNTNIMCSLKSGVSVPNEYIDQLIQNSCLFN